LQKVNIREGKGQRKSTIGRILYRKKGRDFIHNSQKS